MLFKRGVTSGSTRVHSYQASSYTRSDVSGSKHGPYLRAIPGRRLLEPESWYKVAMWRVNGSFNAWYTHMAKRRNMKRGLCVRRNLSEVPSFTSWSIPRKLPCAMVNATYIKDPFLASFVAALTITLHRGWKPDPFTRQNGPLSPETAVIGPEFRCWVGNISQEILARFRYRDVFALSERKYFQIVPQASTYPADVVGTGLSFSNRSPEAQSPF
jgi:hypothetical protein